MIEARRRRAVSVVALAVLVVGVLSACGSESAVDASRSASTSAAPVVTAPPTSTSSTTSTSTSIPATTTTIARQLTLPIPPPADPYGPEDNPPIGRIAIPIIGLETELQEGIRLTTLDRGPGHWPGSAMPGEVGNVVIGGHRTSHKAEFYHLEKLIPGDALILTTETGAHEYVVTGTEVVGPEALWITDPSDTATATLFACHPLGSTAERIVVHFDLATT